MKNHTTTVIRIERWKLKELKRRALEENRSLASLLREIVDDFLGLLPSAEAERNLVASQKHAIRKWAGTGLGEGFSGRDHDEILYGDDS
jgi:hypothetical protein